MARAHESLGHPSAYYLKKTLEERGVNVTEAECSVKCLLCDRFNSVLPRIQKKRKNREKEKGLVFGQHIQQDLSFVKWRGRAFILSVIFERGWRDVIMMVLSSKALAYVHMENWVAGGGVPVPSQVKTDNGGEFLSASYKSFFERNPSCVHRRGPPRTPQTQGMVERSNIDIKSL